MDSRAPLPAPFVIEAAGGASALSRAIGITPQAVGQWRTVPPARALDVERVTGISRYELRPDIYGEAPAQEIESTGGQ